MPLASDFPASRVTFPEELPVSQMRDEIADALAKHQVIIVAGETGSGKTTQLPKIALSLGRTRIAHTQPRRIAARAVAERIAEELGTELGDAVGYQVRFTDRVAEHTNIRLMTDGILLNQIHRDRELRRYDTIIIDEAHERSLNIDFLLGYVKRLLPKRPDLKVIITSATIDPQSFSRHFHDAPIIEVSGRTYPVEIRYRPLVDDEVERDLFEGIASGVDELVREGPGDILVFLSGESEIRDAADFLQGRSLRGREKLEILPLYGRLSAADQHRVFRRSGPGTRRIVLATNVAETSLTVPGITYVIDGGTARISRYSTRSKVQRLPIEAISQASAGQRAGRSGRTSPGVAIRLYSEEDFESRPEYTEPEILRTGLASVILQMLSLGLGNIEHFPFLTPPDRRGVKDGLDLLTELGAVTPDRARGGRITKIGRSLSRIPIEPRFGRMLLESAKHGVTREVSALVAGLTVQDVRERPEAERGKADQLHARFHDPQGDFMTLLNLWNYLAEEREKLSSSAFRRLCKAEFLNYLRVREWMDLDRQLRSAAKSLGITTNRPSTDADAIHTSMLAGLLSQLGVRDDRQDRKPATRGASSGPGRRRPAQEYLGSRGTRFVLHPSSVLAKKPPAVVMTVELVETSRLFARGNAAIDPAWAEDLAAHLVKRQVSDPRWERTQGAAVAYERVTLYGVPIVERRRIQYARVDPVHARELFIRHALVEGEWDSPQAFDRANQQLRREIQQLEERTRRRDILTDEDTIYEFYDERIPAEVVSTRSFEGWWKNASRRTPKLLHLRREDLMSDPETEVDDAAFPRVWQFGDQTLKLKYRFDPTEPDDGVTVSIPLPLLPRVEESEFGKLVPGLRQELVTALIKALPKDIRKHIVPAADWAARLLEAVEPQLGTAPEGTSMLDLLANEIRRHTSKPVTAADFDLEKLPAHLRPTYRVIDERGRTVDAGKSLAALQQQHRERAKGSVANVAGRDRASMGLAKTSVERSGATTWDFGDLPTHLDAQYASRGAGGTVRAYPAIVDRRNAVDVVLVADRDEQARLTRRGLRRLVLLSSPSPASYVREHLSNTEKLLLSGGPHRSLDDALADVGLATAEAVILRHSADGLVWTESQFQAVADEYARTLLDDVYGAIALTAQVLDEARKARKAIDGAKSLQVLGQVADAASQVDALVFPGFVARTGIKQLERLPVYLAGVQHRMAQLPAQPGRDRAWMNEIERVTAAYRAAGGELPAALDAPEKLVRVRWLIEEFRISLFAQHLRTAESVSTQRIERLLAETD